MNDSRLQKGKKENRRRFSRSRRPRVKRDGEAYSVRGFTIPSHTSASIWNDRRARARQIESVLREVIFRVVNPPPPPPQPPAHRSRASDAVEKVVEAGAWSDSESPIVKAASAFLVAGKTVFSGKKPNGELCDDRADVRCWLRRAGATIIRTLVFQHRRGTHGNSKHRAVRREVPPYYR